VDPLTDVYARRLDECGLIDVAPVKLRPTSRNKRVGAQRISKRLDRFLFA
jgi:hypothetical protein